MAIKINGQDLKKRYINNQEIVRVYKAGFQVRPDTVFDDIFWMSKSSGRVKVYLRYDGWGSTPSPSEYPTLEYSFDKDTRTDYVITSDGNYIRGPVILVEAGDKLYRRNKSATTSTIARSRISYWTFHVYDQTGGSTIMTGGDLTSLICKNGSDTVPNYCFNRLLNEVPLDSIPKLTATILGGNCYDELFKSSGVELDTTQHGIYQYPFRLPYSGTIPGTSPTFIGMFDTSGPVVSPSINTIYYCNVPTR